ncbi:right-handed parallel beta-helix repeat-containing protein [Kitasatospora brasiliensis]|uniref:right-handed parallel beta-helix repeat-containing protein n=1 Tax=Kitasatospora brasiliensis TaxID=3058040 RepID=UPI00292E3CFC|nr:right-handed parallel beta-helix repeat-containing protein [Kitasatospora sp. K002]
MLVSHRRLIATAASIAAGFAFLPSQAFAAGPAQPTVPPAVEAPALTGTGPSTPKTFTSPAEKSYRVQGKAAPQAAAAAPRATGRTIYAVTASTCTTDTGTGAEATPFCSLQHAVDAAAPGDTVKVSGTMESGNPARSRESVVIRTSGLTVIGGDSVPAKVDSAGDQPTLTLDGVSDVTISHLYLSAYTGSGTVAVKGSSRITLDSNHIWAGGQKGLGVAIDGASSSVAVTRTHIAPDPTISNTAVTVAAGARDVTLAGNLLARSGIAATGVQGLNVTGNTIQRGCLPAVAVDGAGAAVSIQNNLVVESTEAAACDSGVPAVTVSAESAAATTTDYNDFYSAVTTGAGPYRWAGTAYPTLDAFRAAQPQGAHDTVEAVAPSMVGSGYEFGVAYALQPGSTAIGAANPSAPGALTADFFGNGPMTDRGAVKYLSTNPNFTMALTARNTSAYGITLTVNVTSKPVAQDLYVTWGDGATSVVNFAGDKPVTSTLSHRYQKLGDYTVTATDYDRSGNTVRNTVNVGTVGSQYTPYGPKRLLDTRDGTGATAAKIPAGGTARVQVGGNAGIPTGVTAAVLNLTVTNPVTAGHIDAYPEGGARPATSNVNYQAGQTVPNLVTVPVGANGYVDLYNGGWGSVDLIADITGYFTQSNANGYYEIGSKRLVDTRDGTGAPRGQVGAYRSLPVQIVLSAPGIPFSGVNAVALNITVTDPRSDGHLTVYPSGQGLPTASNVNFTAGQTVANAVIVPVGADGRIQVYNGAWASTDVIVDVVGYYGMYGGAAYMPVEPERLLDTRDASTWRGGQLGGRYYVPLHMTDRSDIRAFVFNTTVTGTRDAGHLSIGADGNTWQAYQNGTAYPQTAPDVSTLNWRRGETVPNMAQAVPGNGIVDLFNESDGPLDLIVDIFGYYQNG